MYFRSLTARFWEKISVKSAYLDVIKVKTLLAFKKAI